ncbi:MAG: DUF1573 domain-containing protein [Verrucomicrobiota bacterium]|nr:DUF1573 domain-containing protein [Verrucomicrobiota bacterium]
MRYLIVCFVFVLISINASFAQLNWEKKIIELNATYKDTEITAIFNFVNSGDSPVNIHKVKTSCGCTTAKLEKRVYRSGESGTIMATFKFGNRVGSQRKKVYVYTSDKNQRLVTLEIKVEIPQVAELSKTFLKWKLGKTLETKNVEVTIRKDADVHIIGVDSSHDFIRPLLKKISDKKYTIEVTPKHITEKANATISIDITYPNKSIKVLKVYARIK